MGVPALPIRRGDHVTRAAVVVLGCGLLAGACADDDRDGAAHGDVAGVTGVEVEDLAGGLRVRFLRPFAPHARHRRGAEALPVPVVLPDAALRIDVDGEHLVPVLSTGGRAAVRLPRRAAGAVQLRGAGGIGIEFAMVGARDAAAVTAGGLVIYPEVLGGRTRLIHRPSASGTEDFLLLDARPDAARIEYELDVSQAAGLRLVEGVLELMDGSGTPRLRVRAPAIVEETLDERPGATHPVVLDVEGCRVDRDPRAPWGRPPIEPGAARCRVVVSWDEDRVRYPALLDPTWTATTSDMIDRRLDHSATLLPDGRVLVAGGYGYGGDATAELYDPGTQTWAATGSLANGRSTHTATLLQDGRVLIAGGSGTDYLATVELYDPATGTWSPGSPLGNARSYHTAHALAGGDVLVIGGDAGTALSAERFDSSTSTWSPTQPMVVPRTDHASVALRDGRVLAFGGTGGMTSVDLTAAEIYEPATDAWTATGSLGVERSGHLGALLSDGRVLGASGWSTISAEVYDPAEGTWTPTAGGPVKYHAEGVAAVLDSGFVLLAGGWDPNDPDNEAELFDPSAEIFFPTKAMLARRFEATATLLDDGAVLVAGANYLGGPNAELYLGDAPGTPCSFAGNCVSGFCVDGVRCDGACSGACEACTRLMTGSSDGTCAPIPAGSDPESECPTELPETCGSKGSCDGAAKCAVHEAGTLCAAPSCEDALATMFACDGAGTCVESSESCAPDGCAGGGCGSSCNGDGSCAPSGWCHLGDATCQLDLEDGAACERDEQCVSSRCIDARCATPQSCVDEHTFVEASGEMVDCAPFACGPSGCHDSCSSILQCAPPSVCRGDGSCGAPERSGADDGGCGAARRAGEGTSGAACLAALCVACVASRRRRKERA